MTAIPETRYARSGDLHIAYQVVGDGPRDVVLVYGYGSNIDVQWEEPTFARFLEGLAGMGRLILLDKRGTGLSDRVDSAATLEERMDDVRVAMDAAGSERAAVLGMTGGVPAAVLFAASRPERVSGLVLYAGQARSLQAPDYPWGATPELFELALDAADQAWGTGVTFDLYAPSRRDDARLRDWVARYERAMGSPGTMLEIVRFERNLDIRSVLPSVRVPTLVLHRSGDRVVSVPQGRYLAESIPGARVVELEGDDHWPWVGDTEALLREIAEFVIGEPTDRAPDRVLATVLFTDLVDSTTRAAELGDRRWKELLDTHEGVVRRQVDRAHGTYLKSTGDGALATFDGPARAIRCARATRDALHALGLEIRAGLHTGEVELVGDDVAGIAVHLAARVEAHASPGEVLVSRTVVDLVAGSEIEFEDRGTHSLKGIPGDWQLYAVKS